MDCLFFVGGGGVVGGYNGISLSVRVQNIGNFVSQSTPESRKKKKTKKRREKENALILLTHYQTTNFRLFQIERLCRRQFKI